MPLQPAEDYSVVDTQEGGGCDAQADPLLVPTVAGLVIIWAAAQLHDADHIAPTHAIRHA